MTIRSLVRNRRLVITVAGAAVLAIAVASALTSASPPDDAPPAQPLVAPAVGPAGQQAPFNFGIPPTVAHPGQPVAYGDFRLVPVGYANRLPHKQLSAPAGQYTATEDQAVMRSSSLFREPAYVPAGYALTKMEGAGPGNAESEVHLLYEGGSFPIMVSRVLISELPVDVRLYPDSGESTVRPANIKGVKAIFEEAKPGSKFQVPLVIQFIQGRVRTVIEWRATGPDGSAQQLQEVQKIAESMIQ